MLCRIHSATRPCSRSTDAAHQAQEPLRTMLSRNSSSASKRQENRGKSLCIRFKRRQVVRRCKEGQHSDGPAKARPHAPPCMQARATLQLVRLLCFGSFGSAAQTGSDAVLRAPMYSFMPRVLQPELNSTGMCTWQMAPNTDAHQTYLLAYSVLWSMKSCIVGREVEDLCAHEPLSSLALSTVVKHCAHTGDDPAQPSMACRC